MVMAYYKDPAVMLGNILGEFKAWYTHVHSETYAEEAMRRGVSSSAMLMESVTCEQFSRYKAIIDLTGRVMRENPSTWSTNMKRNLEVAFCVTGLGDSECYVMLLDDPMLGWVWNAVKQLCTSSLPSVRRLIISLLYRFEKQPDVAPLMMWILKNDQDFVCRYYVALCITKSPLLAFHIDEEIRSEIASLVFRDEYKTNIQKEQTNIQARLDSAFARSSRPDYTENMLVENARVYKGD